MSDEPVAVPGAPGGDGDGGPRQRPPGEVLDGAERAAVVDLLGALAYGELTGFSRLGADADLAPTLTAKAEMARLAVVRFGHYERVRARLEALGVEAATAMEPFVVAVDAFHERTSPSTWLEGLVKAYVGEGISFDFYREISAWVDPTTRALVTTVLADAGQAEFVVHHVRAAIAADPRVGGRLALWGRRLVGEALSQAQRVAADREGLTSLLVGSVDRPGADLAELVRMFGRLTDEHMRRMGRLGLSA